MALVASKTVGDRFNHGYSGCHPDLEGNIGLEPSNFCWNWNFGVLNYDGDPEQFSVGIPEDPEGVLVYMTDVDSGFETMASQVTAPIDIDTDSLHISEPYIPGHRPVVEGRTAPIAPPREPVVVKVPASKVGYKAGTYWVAFSWFDDNESTPLSPATQVTVGQGQNIRLTMPTSVPEDVTHIGIWMSNVGGSASELKLQKKVDVRYTRPVTFLLTGPYTAGRSAPTRNETAKPPPRKPGLRKKRGGRRTKGSRYRVQVTEYDHKGRESLPSEWSDWADITPEDEAAFVELEVEHEGTVGPDGEIDYQVYVEYEADDGTVSHYRLEDPAISNSPFKKRRGKRPKISGRRAIARRRAERRRERERRGRAKTDVSSDTLSTDTAPTEEDTGVDLPDSAFEAVTVENPVLITSPGTYRIGISYWSRGQETKLSPIVPITLAANETIKVFFPDEANYFRNAQWVDLDADGAPDQWVFSGVNGGTQGVYRVEADGSLVLDTNGIRTSGQLSPEVSQAATINREQFYVVGGLMTATVVQGAVEAVAEELDDANNVVATHTMRTISASGLADFEMVFGPGATQFQGSATQLRVKIRWTPSGGNRQGQVNIGRLYFHPHDRILRSREHMHKKTIRSRHRGHHGKHHSRRFSKPHFHYRTRWEKHIHYGVEEAPEVIQRVSAEQAALARVTFENNALPSDWTHRQTNVGGTTSVVSTAAKISGVYGWRVQKTTSSTAKTYIHKQFGTGLKSLAVRFQVRLVQVPTITGKGVSICSFRNGSGQNDNWESAPAWVMLYKDSLVLAKQDDDEEDWDYLNAGTKFVAGDVLDIEMIIGDMGGNDFVDLYVGKNGSPRERLARMTDEEWAEWSCDYVQVGCTYHEDNSMKYTLDFDNIVVTTGGDYSGVAGALPPPEQPYPLPDRPYDPPHLLQTLEFESGKNIATLNQSTGGEFGAGAFSGYNSTPVVASDEDAWQQRYSIRVDTSSVISNTVHGLIVNSSSAGLTLASGTNILCSAYVNMPLGVEFTFSGRTATTGNTLLGENRGVQTYLGTGEWQRVEAQPFNEAQTFKPGCQVLVADSQGPVVFYVDGIQIEQKSSAGATTWEYGVGGGSTLGEGVTLVTSGSATAVRQSGSNITSGTNGVRVTSADTGALSTAYVERMFAGAPVAQRSFRHRMRVVGRPSTGTVDIFQVISNTGSIMARFRLDSSGVLTAQSADRTGTFYSSRQVASGIVNNNILTLEIALAGGGTVGGTATYWVEVGGTGAIETRRLMHQDEVIDWTSGATILGARMGGVLESTASATWSFDVDDIAITAAGEAKFQEFKDDGNPIYQVHLWFPPEQPVRQDLYLNNFHAAVKPGEQYTASVWARHAGIPAQQTAYPFFFTAYDTEGNDYPLGSLYGDNGATGTSPWAERKRTFLIPNDCYEIVMHSKDIGGGEFCCQTFVFSRGVTARREVFFPESGRIRAVLDTRMPNQELAGSSRNNWLDVNCIVHKPEGTDADLLFGSARNSVIPNAWTEDRFAVPQARFAHFDVTLYSDSTRRITPILLDNSPSVDYYRTIGNKQVHTLLREEMDEFPGGVTLSGVHLPRELSQWDVFAPKGKLRRHRRYEEVGSLPPFKITVFREDTMVEIEEDCMSSDFWIESRDRRIQIRFGTQLVFEVKPESPVKNEDGDWLLVAEATSETVEVVAVNPMIGLSAAAETA